MSLSEEKIEAWVQEIKSIKVEEQRSEFLLCDSMVKVEEYKKYYMKGVPEHDEFSSEFKYVVTVSEVLCWLFTDLSFLIRNVQSRSTSIRTAFEIIYRCSKFMTGKVRHVEVFEEYRLRRELKGVITDPAYEQALIKYLSSDETYE